VVRNHPPIRQVDVLLKLDGDHLGIDLNDRTIQPITHAIPLVLVIAKNLNVISNFERIVIVRRGSEI
jgi:hypothetical protein